MAKKKTELKVTEEIYSNVTETVVKDLAYSVDSQIAMFEKCLQEFGTKPFICGISCDYDYRYAEKMAKQTFNFLVDKNFRPYYYKVYDRLADISFQDNINTYGVPDCLFLATYWDNMQLKYYDKLRELVTMYGENIPIFILNTGMSAPDFMREIVKLPLDAFLCLNSKHYGIADNL